MPLYDYRCKECGHREHDQVRSVAEYKTPWPCPHCGDGEMEFIIATSTPAPSKFRANVPSVFRKV